LCSLLPSLPIGDTQSVHSERVAGGDLQRTALRPFVEGSTACGAPQAGSASDSGCSVACPFSVSMRVCGQCVFPCPFPSSYLLPRV
jgi:hypothetical protein